MHLKFDSAIVANAGDSPFRLDGPVKSRGRRVLPSEPATERFFCRCHDKRLKRLFSEKERQENSSSLLVKIRLALAPALAKFETVLGLWRRRSAHDARDLRPVQTESPRGGGGEVALHRQRASFDQFSKEKGNTE